MRLIEFVEISGKSYGVARYKVKRHGGSTLAVSTTSFSKPSIPKPLSVLAQNDHFDPNRHRCGRNLCQ